MEHWKPIPGYEGMYEVSDLGRVKSLARTVVMYEGVTRQTKDRILRTSLQGCGYVFATLCKEGKARPNLVHRLVAQAFVPNPDNKPQVNHKDGNRTNNRADNLEWVTSSENNLHKFRTLGYKNHNRKVVERSDGMRFESATAAARFMGVSTPRISQVCTGKRERSCGYGWRYVDGV